MYSFGPIPSRRLGQSLGVNNIPPKYCSYSCTYCQVGRTDHLHINRRSFYKPEDIFEDVRNRIEKILQKEGSIDYLSFVPDGEPTLDIYLGKEIDLLKPLGYRVAVFSNASLVWQENVRTDLLKSDWVSFKIDTTDEETRRSLNRPHKKLSLNAILEGMLIFAAEFKGFLATETMLVKGINDSEKNLRGIANFLEHLQPSAAYISVPIRPTAEPEMYVPEEETIYSACRVLNQSIDRVECLLHSNGNEFGFTGQVEDDLLRTTAVQPMREEEVEALLKKSHARWDIIHRLIARGDLIETVYEGRRFYVRRFREKRKKEKTRNNLASNV
jgi:wyosine [tRNA(Phe)-imidazoG37] synthetase (radical SAM superfamily)